MAGKLKKALKGLEKVILIGGTSFVITSNINYNAEQDEKKHDRLLAIADARILEHILSDFPKFDFSKEVLFMEREDILKNYLNGTIDENFEKVKSLLPIEFHHLFEKIDFELLRDLTRESSCHEYPTGRVSVENMRKLLPIINENAGRTGLDARTIFSHIFVESRGENSLNCEVGGGPMHLRYTHWEGINPLDEEQNITRGVDYLKRLRERFGNESLASLGFNIGDGIVGRFYYIITNRAGGWKQSIGPKDIFHSMRKSGYNKLADRGEIYLERIERAWNKVSKEKIFAYDPETKVIEYIGYEGGLRFTHPEPSPSKENYRPVGEKAYWDMGKITLRVYFSTTFTRMILSR